MLHRLALFAASLSAALVIAGGLALAGFAPVWPPAAPQAADVAGGQASAPVQVDTVYLAPPAAPEEVTVTKVQSTGGDDEHERAEHEDQD